MNTAGDVLLVAIAGLLLSLILGAISAFSGSIIDDLFDWFGG